MGLAHSAVPSALTLFVRNCGTEGAKGLLRIVPDESTLADQGVKTGALISCMLTDDGTAPESLPVVDLPAELKPPRTVETQPKFDPPARVARRKDVAIPCQQDADAAEDSFDDFDEVADWDSDKQSSDGGVNVDVEGAARRHAQSLVGHAVDAVSAPSTYGASCQSSILGKDGTVHFISTYTWADYSNFVRVYITADSEAQVVASASAWSAKSVDQSKWLLAGFEDQAFRLIVRDEAESIQHVLELHGLTARIVPDASKCTFQMDRQRIVVELRKASPATSWPELLKSRWVSEQHAMNTM